MADWVLVPCLVALRGEFNTLAAGRDKASDGSIADAAHVAGGTSDHIGDETTAAMRAKDPDSRNEVHAIDVDNSGPWPAGFSMEKAVQRIVLRHRAGQDDRLQNVIFNRRIWSRSWGWTARAYTGSNPHDHHAHFSARYTSAQEADTRPWGLLPEEDDMDWNDDVIANPAWRADAKTNKTVQAKFAIADVWNQAHNASVKAAEVSTKLDQVLAQLKALTGKDFTDEASIVAGVLAGLDPQAIAAAIPADLAQQVADELVARLQS
jgi:hypothetical protein